MTTLTDYTTYESVRAALGVSDEELEDATLAEEIFLTELELALDGGFPALDPTLSAIYAALPAETEMTATELKLYKLVRMYSTYLVAKHCLGSIKMFAFQKVGDGRATAERVKPAMSDLPVNIQLMLNRLYGLIAKLLVLLGYPVELPSPVAALNVFSGIGLATDPVTDGA